jgi:hypothetical protein
MDMAPRSTGRSSNPNKPGSFNTAFEQTNDHHQYHEEEHICNAKDSFCELWYVYMTQKTCFS